LPADMHPAHLHLADMHHLLLLLVACLTHCRGDEEEVKQKIKQSVDEVTQDFVDAERIFNTAKLSYGYFIVYTPVSQRIGRDARLLDKVEEHLIKKSNAGKKEKDYTTFRRATLSPRSDPRERGGTNITIGKVELTRSQMLQHILDALNIKDQEQKREHGSDYQAETDAEPNPEFNPITGQNSSTGEREHASSPAIVSEKTRISLRSDSCRRQGYIECRESERYRRIDGTCNNLVEVEWGAAARPYRRLLAQDYPDEVGQLRDRVVHSDGKKIKLPEPRLLCRNLHYSRKNRKSNITTTMVMQYGQFLDHDITLTPEMEQRCCKKINENRAECAPFFIPTALQRRDSIFNFKPTKKQKCIPFTRSTAACNVGEVKVREQFNGITAFVDMSSVYASDPKWQQAMRTTEFHLERCQDKTQRANKGRYRRWCPGTLKENENEKGLPTRDELGIASSDFMEGQSVCGRYAVHRSSRAAHHAHPLPA